MMNILSGAAPVRSSTPIHASKHHSAGIRPSAHSSIFWDARMRTAPVKSVKMVTRKERPQAQSGRSCTHTKWGTSLESIPSYALEDA